MHRYRYHGVAIAYLYQPSPRDEDDAKSGLQFGFPLMPLITIKYTLRQQHTTCENTHHCSLNHYFLIMAIHCDARPVHAAPTNPEQKSARSLAQNWNNQPSIKRMRNDLHNKQIDAADVVALLKVSLVYHTELSSFIGWRKGWKSTLRSWQHQALYKYGNASWRHVRTHACLKSFYQDKVWVSDLLIEIDSGYFRGELVAVKKLCGHLLLSFYIPSYSTTKFSLNPVHWSHNVKREPPYSRLAPSPAFPTLAAHPHLWEWIISQHFTMKQSFFIFFYWDGGWGGVGGILKNRLLFNC